MIITFLTYLNIILSIFLNREYHPINYVTRFSESSHDSIGHPRFVCNRMADSLELVKLYSALDGPNWFIKWNLNDPIDDWFGVTLNTDGCVECLNFSGGTCNNYDFGTGNNLRGALFDLSFPFLKFLFINEHDDFFDSDKRLTGPIPNFSGVPLLEDLVLSGNFNGDVPDFTSTPNLHQLIIHGEMLETIPDFSNLKNLKNLGLTGIFRDSIPDFKFLDKLESLSIWGYYKNINIPDFYSDVTGKIPNFSHLQNLKNISIQGLAVTGSIPDFNKLPFLQYLHIYRCVNLIGPLPTFSGLAELREITILFCKNINGPLPIFTNSSNLSSIGLVGNSLSGLIQEFSNFNPQLRSLSLESNKFTFKDIIENLNNNTLLVNENKIMFYDTLTYAPQDSVYRDTTIRVYENDNLIIDLFFDNMVLSNNYYWFKNNLPYDTVIGSNKLNFNNIKPIDSGIYTVHIKNPFAPDLTLYSYPIEVKVIPCSVPSALTDNINLDESTPSSNIDLLENDILPNEPNNYLLELLSSPLKFGIFPIGSPNFLISVDINSPSFNEILKYRICDTTCELACDTGSLVVTWTSPNAVPDKPILLTPNGDRVNDILFIDGIDKFPNNELFIVNRWGDIVYHAKPYMNDWGGEGPDGALLTQGSYYYILRNVGSQIPEGGDIVILK